MKWFWKVRLYGPKGQYAYGCIETERNLNEIDLIQDFYHTLTGAKMLLEGMSETWFNECPTIDRSFYILWQQNE